MSYVADLQKQGKIILTVEKGHLLLSNCE
jgi:hypothetical protein